MLFKRPQLVFIYLFIYFFNIQKKIFLILPHSLLNVKNEKKIKNKKTFRENWKHNFFFRLREPSFRNRGLCRRRRTWDNYKLFLRCDLLKTEKKRKKRKKAGLIASFFPFLVQERWWERGNLEKRSKYPSFDACKSSASLRSATKLHPNFSFSPPILWIGEADQDRFPSVLYIHMTFGRSIIDRPEKEGP